MVKTSVSDFCVRQGDPLKVRHLSDGREACIGYISAIQQQTLDFAEIRYLFEASIGYLRGRKAQPIDRAEGEEIAEVGISHFAQFEIDESYASRIWIIYPSNVKVR
jgi:hypothetical protein